jgi:coenzyme F420 hydrogenase subunit beta
MLASAIQMQENEQLDQRKKVSMSIAETVARVKSHYRHLLETAEDEHEWAYAWRCELNSGGFRANDFLMGEIVDTGKCIGCASCVAICPTSVFDYANELPVNARPDACVQCVLCADVCPVLRPLDKDLPNSLNFREDVIDEGFGPYSYMLYTRATDPEILAAGQDGGMVSALLLHHFQSGRLKAAVVGDVLPENNQIGTHRLATTREDLLSCAASRYTYSPNTVALQEAMEKGVSPLAVVGVPCQINGVRLQQFSSIKAEMANWYRKNIKLTIGLACSESFTHESLEKLGEMLDINADRIYNINIKGKVVVQLDDPDGEVLTTSLKKYRDFARPACLYCTDYAAETADIGAGGIGIDGWTCTWVRTEAGHEALQAAINDGWLETRPIEDEPRGKWLTQRIAAAKRKNRPHPARMPTLAEREQMGHLDPKTFYTTGPGAPPPDESAEEKKNLTLPVS